MKKPGQLFAGFLDDFSGFQAKVIARTSGIDAGSPVKLVHEGIDVLGLGEGRRAVVQKDKFAHSDLLRGWEFETLSYEKVLEKATRYVPPEK
jgi:hypothetical protein